MKRAEGRKRTRDGTRTLVTTCSASGLVSCDGNGEILLVLQDLVRDTLKRLCCVDTYRKGKSMYWDDVLMR